MIAFPHIGIVFLNDPSRWNERSRSEFRVLFAAAFVVLEPGSDVRLTLSAYRKVRASPTLLRDNGAWQGKSERIIPINKGERESSLSRGRASERTRFSLDGGDSPRLRQVAICAIG